MIKIKYLQIF